MYFSFVLPVMEYANVVWGGSSDTNIAKLEKIHVDGMRLVTGATARSNTINLYNETAWLTISQRIDAAVLKMMFKIKNKKAPQYLCNILPGENKDRSTRVLRNQQNIAQIPGKYLHLETFKNSFIPRGIGLWNSLPVPMKKVKTFETFTSELKKNKKEPNIMFYYGQRWPSVHHARIRIGCSKLNFDLCRKLHVIDYQTCVCGHKKEDAHHFFMTCIKYSDIRMELFNTISVYSNVTLSIILHGNPKLSSDKNKYIFDAVHKFITDTKRFQ